MVPKRPLACVPVLLAILLVAKAHAIIDPNFTPIHLVGQSALILELDLKRGKTKDQYLGTVREVLKGKTDLKVLTFDLSKAANEQHVDGFRRLVKASAGQPALFFVGTFLADDPGDGETGGAPPKKVGYLHVSAKWCDFQGGTGTAWDLTVLATAREKLWAGGTDMLRRAVDYILGEDNPQVPVKAGASWRGKPSRVGTFAGGIRAVKPIDLAGNGEFALFVAADKGDRLLVCDRKTRKFKDVTARKKLSSASQFFGWGEFNGDGTLDLISLSGGRLSLYAQQADGAFRPAALDLPAALAKDCVGLVALDCGNKRLSGVLVSGASAPRLVVFRANAKPAVIPLTTRGVDVAKYGRAGACIVADFDGDHLPDIIQPFTKGSLFFKGRAPGKFAPAAACAMYLGPGRSNWCLADFDADGRLDIFTVAEDACRIWQNQGGGKFAELLNASGEIAYISQGRGIDDRTS